MMNNVILTAEHSELEEKQTLSPRKVTLPNNKSGVVVTRAAKKYSDMASSSISPLNN